MYAIRSYYDSDVAVKRLLGGVTFDRGVGDGVTTLGFETDGAGGDFVATNCFCGLSGTMGVTLSVLGTLCTTSAPGIKSFCPTFNP